MTLFITIALLVGSIFLNVWLYIQWTRTKKTHEREQSNRKAPDSPSNRIKYINVRTGELEILGATDEEIESFEQTKHTYHGNPIYKVPSTSRIYHKWREAFKKGDIK